MIKVRFFAGLREKLGTSELDYPAEGISNLMQLRTALVAERGPDWAEALQAENVVVALNQEVCQLTAAVSSGDEVAFYPPVTGG